jgi:hypothetical protein
MWGSSLSGYIDGSWVDQFSLLGGTVYATREYIISNPKPKFISKTIAVHIAHGVVLFPLAMLGLSAFSTPLTHELLTSSRLILSIAGIVAFFAIVEKS